MLGAVMNAADVKNRCRHCSWLLICMMTRYGPAHSLIVEIQPVPVEVQVGRYATTISI